MGIFFIKEQLGKVRSQLCIYLGGKTVPGEGDKCKGPEEGGNMGSDHLNPCGSLYKLPLIVLWPPLESFEEWVMRLRLDLCFNSLTLAAGLRIN